MKNIILLSALFLSTQTFASPKEGGTVYICTNKDNSIKLTADLSEKKSERVAVIFVDGITQTYSEFKGEKSLNLFLVGAVKNSTLQIKKHFVSPSSVTLETDSENSRTQIAHQDEHLIDTKFDAFLTLPKLDVKKEPVSCLEMKGTN
jgi:hypothetical protein